MQTAITRAKVTAKGQVTLRRGLLDHLGARPGDHLKVIPLPNGHLDITVDRKTGSWDAFFGSIKYDGPSISIEEMNEVIAKGYAGELDD